MIKRYTTWVYTTGGLMILTGLVHALSFIFAAQASNETEQKMLDLMGGYVMDMGAGYHRTMMNLFTALSSCFTTLYLFGGILLIYLIRKNVKVELLKGVLNISLVFFGASFLIMAFLTFPPPIVVTGLVFFGLLVSRFMAAQKIENNV